MSSCSSKYCHFLEDGLLNEVATCPLPSVHVINLGDDVPGAIKLDECVEVSVVAADHVPLHIDAHHCRRWRYGEHVDSRFDVWRSAVFLDKVMEVLIGPPSSWPFVKPYITASLWKA